MFTWHICWAFDLLLINYSKYFLFEVLISHCIKQILYVKRKQTRKRKQRYTHFHLPQLLIISILFFCFSFNVELKIPYQQLLIFLRFMNTTIKVLKLNSDYNTLAEAWTLSLMHKNSNLFFHIYLSSFVGLSK